MVRPRVFFDFAIDSAPAGRVVFELLADSASQTAENFRALCTGEKGLSPLSNRLLYYKNSIIHRSIPAFMIQGGDFTKRNGTGGESIYSGVFLDEDLSRPLDAPGLLCMANKGPNTNGSQFFITLRECPHLNGKHVVFGRVIRGLDIVQKIAEVPTDPKDRPVVPVSIVNCGELVLRVKPQSPSSQARAVRASQKESEDDDERRKKRPRQWRRRDDSDVSDRASPFATASEDESDRERRHHKKHRKHKYKDPKPKSRSKSEVKGVTAREPTAPSSFAVPPAEETEEQYDARLEREERERLEEARTHDLERLKEREHGAAGASGVRFKGE